MQLSAQQTYDYDRAAACERGSFAAHRIADVAPPGQNRVHGE